MTRQKTVDLATTADWRFTEVPGVLDAFRNICSHAAREFGKDAADLEQELLLHVAVRPALTERDWDDDHEIARFLAAVRTKARRMALDWTANDWRIDYLEDEREDEDW